MIRVKHYDVVVGAQVPLSIAQRLRAQAVKNDRTVSGELRQILKAWAAQQGEQEGVTG